MQYQGCRELDLVWLLYSICHSSDENIEHLFSFSAPILAILPRLQILNWDDMIISICQRSLIVYYKGQCSVSSYQHRFVTFGHSVSMTV